MISNQQFKRITQEGMFDLVKIIVGLAPFFLLFSFTKLFVYQESALALELSS